MPATTDPSISIMTRPHTLQVDRSSGDATRSWWSPSPEIAETRATPGDQNTINCQTDLTAAHAYSMALGFVHSRTV